MVENTLRPAAAAAFIETFLILTFTSMSIWLLLPNSWTAAGINHCGFYAEVQSRSGHAVFSNAVRANVRVLMLNAFPVLN